MKCGEEGVVIVLTSFRRFAVFACSQQLALTIHFEIEDETS